VCESAAAALGLDVGEAFEAEAAPDLLAAGRTGAGRLGWVWVGDGSLVVFGRFARWLVDWGDAECLALLGWFFDRSRQVDWLGFGGDVAGVWDFVCGFEAVGGEEGFDGIADEGGHGLAAFFSSAGNEVFLAGGDVDLEFEVWFAHLVTCRRAG